jgi:diacylglycerol kinase family enzyme
MPLLLPETPFLIVLNYASGSGDGRADQAVIERILAEAGRPHRFFVVEDPKQLPRIAADAAAAAVREAGAVIAAGGDGTINAVAQATLPTGRPFGIVPQGTFNYTTRSHGIPLDVAEATRTLLTAELSPMQVGMVNDQVFLVNASLGLYPKLLEARETDKHKFGRYRLVAIASGLFSLLRNHRQLRLDIERDDTREAVRTPALFIGNNAMQLERAGLPAAEAVKHHRLAAVLVRPVGTLALLWLALRGALGQLAGAERIRAFAFQRLEVSTRGNRHRRLKVATDGEVRWMKPPVVFSISPSDLMLMVPGTKRGETAS